jgi:hypothetical protein
MLNNCRRRKLWSPPCSSPCRCAVRVYVNAYIHVRVIFMFINLFIQCDHAKRLCIMDMEDGHAGYTEVWTCNMDMQTKTCIKDKQHVSAASTSSMDKNQGYVVRTCRMKGYAAWKLVANHSMNIRHAAWTGTCSMDIRPCSTGINMQHGRGRA